MSPKAGRILVDEILPKIIMKLECARIMATTGEDREELLADTVAIAAKRLHSAEAEGAPYTANAVAHYAVLALKSGRRFGSAGRVDPLSAGCQLDGNSQLVSMDEEIEAEECTTLHDLLANRSEAPDTAASREMDWADLMPNLSDRQQNTVVFLAAGLSQVEVAATFDISPPAISDIRAAISKKIQRFWGQQVIEDVTASPGWKLSMGTHAERRRCRFDRKRANSSFS